MLSDYNYNTIIDILKESHNNEMNALYDLIKVDIPHNNTKQEIPKVTNNVVFQNITKKCSNCRYGPYCSSDAAKKNKCGEPDYNYFEPKE